MEARKQHTRSVPAKRPEARLVATYNSDGQRLRAHTLASIQALLDNERVVCQYNKRGSIVSATFRPLPQSSSAVAGKSPILKRAHQGQKYSYKEPVTDTGRRVWRFAKFLVPVQRNADAEAFLQKVFRAVPLSCMTGAQIRTGTGTASAEASTAGPRPRIAA